MRDFIFIFFTILITTGLIYFLYKLMLGADKSENDRELQITSEEIVQQLTILHKQKRNNIVESLAKNYLEKKSGDDAVRTILIKALYDLGRIYEAMEHAKVIIRHKPNNFDMQIFVANCCLEIEDSMKAINIFKDILGSDPHNVVAIKSLAQVYFKTNQKKAALEMYKRLEEYLENAIEKAKIKSIIAEIHVGYQNIGLAIAEYEQILEIYPEEIKIKKRLIELYKLLPDYDSLIKIASDLAMASNNDENDLWAMNRLMEAYHLLGDYEEALNYANMIKNHPMANQSKVNEYIAKILFDDGKVDDSVELLVALIANDPKNVKLKKELSKVYEAKQNFELATDIYKEIIELVDVDEIKKTHFELSNIYCNWAIHLFSQGESSDCFNLFATALQYCDKNPDIYYCLGNVNKTIKNFHESISQYKKAIEIDPKNPNYYAALAECYDGIDNIYEEKKILLECLKYGPENAEIHYKLGLIHEEQNDQNSAMASIKKAIELDSNFIVAKRKLALMFEHFGDKESAVRIYEEILISDPDNEEIANNLKMLVG